MLKIKTLNLICRLRGILRFHGVVAAPNPKIPRKQQNASELYLPQLTVDHSLGPKDAKSSILLSISRDQLYSFIESVMLLLNQSEVSRNKLQKMYEIK